MADLEVAPFCALLSVMAFFLKIGDKQSTNSYKVDLAENGFHNSECLGQAATRRKFAIAESGSRNKTDLSVYGIAEIVAAYLY